MGGRLAALLLGLSGLAVLVAAVVAQARLANGTAPPILLAAVSAATLGVQLVASSGSRRILGEGSLWSMPRFSPDGRTLAAVDEGRDAIVLFDLESSESYILWKGAGGVLGLAWAPDGHYLAVPPQPWPGCRDQPQR